MRTPEKILIIRLSSLGDILHALPAFVSLRATFPDARIDWLVEQRNSFLLSAVDGIDEVLILDTYPMRAAPWQLSSWESTGKLIRLLRSRQYDLSIDFQGLLKTGLMSVLSGARDRIGFPRDLVRERPAHWFYRHTPEPPRVPMHVVALNQLLAQSAGAHPVKSNVSFAVSDQDEALVQSLLDHEGISRFVVVNPGGGWHTKRWDPARYGRLAVRIQEELELPVIATTGPGEKHLFTEISRHCGKTAVRNFQLEFLQLIPLLRKACLLIGGDTGPFHLACALGTPVVGIFGPTSPQRNGPWRAGEESVFRILPCSFCNGRSCPTRNECMDITVDEVFQAVLKRIGRNQ
ncbi:MAG TPA: glycosyltransferase family 9 protein [Acidobacteriota bacterium]|nr:glycosyltransferase family 9 protein [Acidobacteriota bacterium]